MIKVFFRYWKRWVSALIVAVLLVGCKGADMESVTQETPALLDPEGAASNYEIATYRDLYNAKVLDATVDFYVEEYSYTDGQSFACSYVAPGQTVSKGEALISGDMNRLEDQIEEEKKALEEMEENYADYEAAAKEDLQPLLDDKEFYYRLTIEYKDREPEFTQYGNEYQKAKLAVQYKETEIKHRKELYEIDHAYALSKIERLQEKKQECVLRSEIDGTVVAMQYYEYGNYIEPRKGVVAVGDTQRIEIHCNYVNKAEMNNAKEAYAYFNGKKYPVTYQEMTTEEYNRRVRLKKPLYSTFLVEGEEMPELGAYGAIVIITDSRNNVLTISKDVVHRDGEGSFVYLLRDGESIRTAVNTGMSDGIYTEILEGIVQGDKVLSNETIPLGTKTVKVEKGELKRKLSISAYAYYPENKEITCPVKYGTCYLAESTVKKNQPVKKGDVLATVTVERDEVSLKRKTLQRQRCRERLADLRSEDEKEKKIEIKRTNARNIKSLEKTIEKLNKEIAEMENSFSVSQIVAPMDGIVTWISEYDEQEKLPYRSTLFVVSQTTPCLVLANDTDMQLRYGNEVSVQYTDKEGKEQETTGWVVSTNGAFLGDEFKTANTMIQMPDEDVQNIAMSTELEGGVWNRARLSVTAEIKQMKDVLVVPTSAVTENNGKYYVKVKIDDKNAAYVGFIPCGKDDTYYGVAQGLTEGMELCY